jgi:hypothetical protein
MKWILSLGVLQERFFPDAIDALVPNPRRIRIPESGFEGRGLRSQSLLAHALDDKL